MSHEPLPAQGPADVNVGRISDADRMDYLETHEVATEFHDEWGSAYCVSRDDGFWEKRATLRDAVDAAIEANDSVSCARGEEERRELYRHPTTDMLIDAGVAPNPA